MTDNVAGFEGLDVEADVAGRMIIRDPYSGSPLVNAETDEEAWIDVLSEHSKVGAKFTREGLDRIFQRKGRQITVDEFEREIALKASRLATGWSLVTMQGQPIAVPFTRANALELFSRPGMRWLRDQVVAYAADLGNYRATTSTVS